MGIEFKRLSEVAPQDIIEQMNNPRLREHMPLAQGRFTEEDCAGFVRGKESLWEEYGYGPWAFVVDGEFAGWGGLQPEEGDADLALVLHPNYWGWGKRIYDQIIERAFGEMGFESITALLPPSRTRVGGMLRAGFQRDGELDVGGERFIRYRLFNPHPEKGASIS